MVQYKLHYFPVRGRGEFIKYILEQSDASYENVILEIADWKSKQKANYELGVIPALEVDGKFLYQSLTIGNFLAERYNLAGSNEWNKATASMVVHFIEDIYPKGYFPIVKGYLEKDEKAKLEGWAALRDSTVNPLFEKFEKLLGDKKWFCGDELTWADLYVGELTERFDSCFEKGYMSKYPKLQQHMKRVHELPKIKKYVSTRPEMFV